MLHEFTKITHEKQIVFMLSTAILLTVHIKIMKEMHYLSTKNSKILIMPKTVLQLALIDMWNSRMKEYTVYRENLTVPFGI